MSIGMSIKIGALEIHKKEEGELIPYECPKCAYSDPTLV